MHVDDRIFFTATSATRPAAAWVLVTPPAVEPVSVDELREFARIDSKTEARTLGLMIKAARSYFERVTGLALLRQTWRLELDRVPLSGEIALLRAPLLAISPDGVAPAVVVNSVTTLDSTGAVQTMAAADYVPPTAGAARGFLSLTLASSSTWPDLGDFPAALRVEFNAGFGTTAASVPEDIRLSVLMLAAWWYENRLPINIGNITSALPLHLDSLIELHRVAFIA